MRNPCCCCKQYTRSEFVLATLVDDYAAPCVDGDGNPCECGSGGSCVDNPDYSPGGILPYPRGGSVSGDNCPNGDYGGTGQIPCGPWPFSLIPRAAGGADYFHEGNQFNDAETEAIVETICDTPGHKVAQTVKQWHGMLPLTFCEDGCTEVATRYRSITIEITGAVRDNDNICGSIFVYDEKRTWTVNRYSGEITLSDKICNSHGRDQTSPGVWENAALATPSFDDYITFDPCDPDSKPVVYDEWATASDNISHSLSKSATSLEWHILNAITPAEGQCDPIEDQEYVTEDGKLITAQFDVVVTLGDAYTADNVRTDADAAIAYWLFPNNLLFPWRSDTLRSLGVIAQYNELTARSPNLGNAGCATLPDYANPTAGSGTGGDPYTAWAELDWYDEDAYEWVFPDGGDQTNSIGELVLRYDGSIIGQPFKSGTPTGLPDHMFSWGHQTWACYIDFTGENWEVRLYGAYAGEDSTGIDASDLVIPKSAPLWTENRNAGLQLPGSYLLWTISPDDGGPGSLYGQKQIELTQAFDAYNRFGPCGYHRHSPDVAKSSCVDSYSGTETFATGDTLTLRDAIGDGTYDAIIFGGANTPKRFSVTVTGISCVVGAEVTNARHVSDATDFWTEVPDIDLGLGIVARVRDWKRSGVSFTPPPICGKVRVTGVSQDGDDVVLTVATLYTQIGDAIDCVGNDAADTVFADNAGAGYTLTAVSDTQLRYTGTMDENWLGKYIKTHGIFDPLTGTGAPLAKFYTTSRKRQFVWQKWKENAATGDFDSTPVNTDDSYNGTKILGCTPNTATDVEAKWKTNAFTDGYPFPATPTASTCGGRALVIPIQFINHPLFQTPYSCDVDINICAPKVEAITAARLVSEGAPALPDGCTFGLPTTAPVPAGNDCTSGMPNGHSSPWNLC